MKLGISKLMAGGLGAIMLMAGVAASPQLASAAVAPTTTTWGSLASTSKYVAISNNGKVAIRVTPAGLLEVETVGTAQVVPLFLPTTSGENFTSTVSMSGDGKVVYKLSFDYNSVTAITTMSVWRSVTVTGTTWSTTLVGTQQGNYNLMMYSTIRSNENGSYAVVQTPFQPFSAIFVNGLKKSLAMVPAFDATTSASTSAAFTAKVGISGSVVTGVRFDNGPLVGGTHMGQYFVRRVDVVNSPTTVVDTPYPFPDCAQPAVPTYTFFAITGTTAACEQPGILQLTTFDAATGVKAARMIAPPGVFAGVRAVDLGGAAVTRVISVPLSAGGYSYQLVSTPMSGLPDVVLATSTNVNDFAAPAISQNGRAVAIVAKNSKGETRNATVVH